MATSPEATTDPYALAGIIAAMLGFFAAPIVGSLVAIGCGIHALRRIARDPATGGARMARAAVTLGVAGVLLWTMVLLTLRAVVR